MARKFDATRPTRIRTFGIPSTPGRRTFEKKGLELRPAGGPAIPIPEGQEATEDRFARWQASHSRGSLPEFIVWEYLVNQKKQTEGVDFVFQWNILGGRTQFGGAIADFYFPHLNMIWNVQGLRYHRTNPDDRARDMIFKQLMTSQGRVVVFLWEDDLLTRPTFVLDLAFQGQQVAGREVTA